MRSRRRSRTSGFALAIVAFAATAHADDGDGTYGRFDGDLGVAGAAGVALGPRSPRMALDARFRYLQTAGIFATYEDGFGGGEPLRVLGFGLEIRPLFLARWAKNWELGSPYLDLGIDSLALELGATFVQPDGARFGARPGLEAGLGLELPVFAKVSGPFLGLHGGARWSDAALAGGPLAGPSDRALYLNLVVGFQEVFGGHVVDLGDRRHGGR